MRKRIYTAKLIAEMNVVPYIDVMLVLLVIFMITAPLIYQGVNVKLPKANSVALSVENLEPIIVSVDVNGNYYLNVTENPNNVLSAKQMALRVAAELNINPDRKVMVKGDSSANYGQVVSAMSVLQSVGVDGVGLVTRQPVEVV